MRVGVLLWVCWCGGVGVGMLVWVCVDYVYKCVGVRVYINFFCFFN